jgi:hypothetical protein
VHGEVTLLGVGFSYGGTKVPANAKRERFLIASEEIMSGMPSADDARRSSERNRSAQAGRGSGPSRPVGGVVGHLWDKMEAEAKHRSDNLHYMSLQVQSGMDQAAEAIEKATAQGRRSTTITTGSSGGDDWPTRAGDQIVADNLRNQGYNVRQGTESGSRGEVEWTDYILEIQW